MKKFNYKLEIEIFRNFTPKKLGVLMGSFEGFGCPKRHPDALLAKTMDCEECPASGLLLPLSYLELTFEDKLESSGPLRPKKSCLFPVTLPLQVFIQKKSLP